MEPKDPEQSPHDPSADDTRVIRSGTPDEATQPIDDFAEQTIGPYRILGVLGRGGMGTVFEAEQESPRRRVAVKVVRGGRFVDDLALRLFRREAELLGRLDHPSIARVFEAGRTDDGQPYFAMELVRGASLGSLAGPTKEHALDRAGIRLRLGVFTKVCDAVNYAHQRGVVHRDLKPANVIVTREADAEGVPDVKVLDFGLAKLTDAEEGEGTLMTETGQLRGTIAYMSPEQIKGDPRAIDLRTDVYALGVCLYELLTGGRPYDTTTSIVEAARVICEDPPQSLTKSWSGAVAVDRDLDTIVRTAMAKDPDRRYPSAAALADDVQRYLARQPIAARPASTAYVLRKLVERNKLASALAASVLALVMGFGVVMAVLYQQSEANLRRAVAAEAEAATEATTANQVTDFLVELFEVVDPRTGEGRTVTAREILDRGSVRMRDALGDQPRVRARLLGTLGRVYTGLGLYDNATALHRDRMALEEARLGDDPSALGPATLDLAKSLTNAGRFREASDLLDGFLADLEQDPDAPATLVAEVNVSLLEAIGTTGSVDSLKTIAARAESLVIDAFGPDAPMLGTFYLARGNMHYAARDMGAAEADFARSRDLMIERLGPDALDVADPLMSLSNVYIRTARAQDAVAIGREVVDLYTRVLGPRHPRAIHARGNLALNLIQSNQALEAEAELQEVARLFRETQGEDSGDYATSIYNLGFFYMNRGEHDRAIEFIERAHELRVAIFGERSLPVSSTAVQLGTLYRVKERYEDSLAMIELAVAIDEAELGGAHSDLGFGLLELAQTQYAMGLVDEAAATRARAQAVFQAARNAN